MRPAGAQLQHVPGVLWPPLRMSEIVIASLGALGERWGQPPETSSMNSFLICAISLLWLLVLIGAWLSWQLLRQNGRILLRLDDVEERLHELEFGEAEELSDSSSSPDALANRFGNRSLARSRINRSGLKAGTRAPAFSLPRLEGGELSLEQLRGRRVLLVFSD